MSEAQSQEPSTPGRAAALPGVIDEETIAALHVAEAAGVAFARTALAAAEAANSAATDPGGHARAAALLATLYDTQEVTFLFLGFQFYFRTGDLEAAERWARRRVAVVTADRLEEHEARAHSNLGLVLMQRTTPAARAEALEHLLLAVSISNHRGDQAGLSRDLGNLASAYEADGYLGRARVLNHRALDIARAINAPALALTKLANLGDIAVKECDLPTARACYAEAVALMRSTGKTKHLAEYHAKLSALDALPPRDDRSEV